MPLSRSSGLLLHPTCLPGPGGIGAIGRNAYRFVDVLTAAGASMWQMLPLGPTGYGDSPYSGTSAFAGNPLLIDPELLARDGLLDADEIDLGPDWCGCVDFARVRSVKTALLHRAFERFSDRGPPDTFHVFCASNAKWLDDFALFMALKEAHGGIAWSSWEPGVRSRDPHALERARERHFEDLAFQRFSQFVFHQQWKELHDYAGSKGVQIIGDIPIFVAYDSVDVWAHQSEFMLDSQGLPTVVAGVPPDYFSKTGQRWGNPHYRWDAMRDAGFDWWIDRFRMLLKTVDIVRLDHFRGFSAAWAVPNECETAERGQWIKAPGRDLFNAAFEELGPFPIIAEDLGVITPDVVELREEFGLPGMHILQFAFATDAHDAGLPHNFDRATVVYSGTHDNDTTVGWFNSIDDAQRQRVLDYLGTRGFDIGWDFIELGLSSVADVALFPLQDVLRLGTTARMNLPGKADGNWGWRFDWNSISDAHILGLRKLNDLYGRTPSTNVRDVSRGEESK